MADDIRDLAPWVAEMLDRLARVSGEFQGVLSDAEIRAALADELERAPRKVTVEELVRGCAIATELMLAEVYEKVRVPA
jgi:hypothetical protein